MSEKIVDIDKTQEDVISNCLNCGQTLSQNYCANCGQSRHIHRSLAAVWHDFSHGVLHFDGKFWRTLPMLMFKPGVLTREYIAGKRAQYISPMALFLFSIFIMFAVFSFVQLPMTGFNEQNVESIKEVASETKEDLLAAKERIENDIASDKLIDENGSSNVDKLKGIEIALGVLGDEDQSTEKREDIVQVDGLDEFLEDKKELEKQFKSWIDLINNNSELLLYKMKSSGYKFSWLLIPISLPFVWFAMLGVRGHHFYDHAIFTIYSMSFVTLLFITLAIMGSIGFLSGWLIPAGVIIPIIHLYKQLRHAYQLPRWQTFLRLIILCIGIVFSLLIFFAILLLLGILG